MKINFEGFKNTVKATAFVVSGLTAGIASGQGKEVPTKTMGFLEQLQQEGILDKNLNEAQLKKLSESESEMKRLGEEHRILIGAKLPNEVKGGTVISRTAYGVNEKKEGKKVEPKTSKKEFNFETWFREQIKLGNEGKTMEAPDGKSYPIIVDRTRKISSTPKVEHNIVSDPGDALASTGENTEDFVLLKNKKFEK